MSELLKAPRIDGAKIAVVLENKFIPEEIAAYLNGFPLLGGEVELVSRLWYGDYSRHRRPSIAMSIRPTTLYGPRGRRSTCGAISRRSARATSTRP